MSAEQPTELVEDGSPAQPPAACESPKSPGQTSPAGNNLGQTAPGGLPPSSNKKAASGPPPQEAYKKQLKGRIAAVLKERTGPSFEERMNIRAAKFREEAKAVEVEQKEKIEASKARAKAHPCESPVRPKELEAPSIEERGKEHARHRRETEAWYAKEAAARKHRMDTREPLYKLSEVNAAIEEQKQRQKEHRAQLQKDEDDMWQHLRELQERVVTRPLLVETGPNIPGDSNEQQAAEASSPSTGNFQKEIRAKINGRIRRVLKERTGPSFEERMNVRAAKFRAETKVTEAEQKTKIDDALARAKTHPCESPFRSKELDPMSIEEWGKHHARNRRETENWYKECSEESKRKLDAREPLFKVAEVEAVFEMQRQRQKDRKRQLQKEEREQWEHLADLSNRVLERPMLVEKFERPVHSKSETPSRLVPNHTKPPVMQQIITKSVSQPWFLDSAWGKEVAALKGRMDQRVPLSQIAYPPYKKPEKPPPTKIISPLDQRLLDVRAQPWFQKSAWADQVKEIQQRQDERPRLHEISYPKKED